MERLGCSPKFLSIVIQLHKDRCDQVKLNSDLSGSFSIVNGVKQGCVLAPTLFNIFFSMMLKQIIEDLDDGAVYIRYRLDGSLFNPQETASPHKTLEQLFRDFLFADDASLVAHNERVLQYLNSCFAEVAQFFGLEVSLKKTEDLHQPAPLEEYRPPDISINGTDLKAVHQFTSLGCIITSDAEITSIEAMLLKSQLRWAGNIFRMRGHRLPKYGELSSGLRDKGTPKKRFKDSLKKTSVSATLTTTSGRHLLLTVRPDAAPSKRSSPPLRIPAEPNLGRNAAGRRSIEPQQPYQTRPDQTRPDF